MAGPAIFSVQEYQQLGELGVLTPDDRVELLEGWIVPKMNQKLAHGFVVGALTERTQRQLPDGLVVRCQLLITTANSEPEPDIVIVRGAHADYRDHHPSGQDCRLVIEVADTSIDRDRRKAAIYGSRRLRHDRLSNPRTALEPRMRVARRD